VCNAAHKPVIAATALRNAWQCCTWKANCTVPSARVDASILSMPTWIVSSCEAMVLLSCVFVA
jgi:hypothetical protein